MNVTVHTVSLLNWRRIIRAIGTGYSYNKQFFLIAKQMLLGQGLFAFLTYVKMCGPHSHNVHRSSSPVLPYSSKRQLLLRMAFVPVLVLILLL